MERTEILGKSNFHNAVPQWESHAGLLGKGHHEKAVQGAGHGVEISE